MVKKIGEEQKAQAVRIALGGGNPLPYLKQCGSKNPSASWAYIKNCLAKKDPETFAKIEAEQPVQAPVVKLSGPLKIETPEAAKVEVVETPEKDFAKRAEIFVPLEVYAVKSRVMRANYRYDDGNLILEGPALLGNTILMTGEEWVKFSYEIRKAMEQLGVKE